MVVDQSASLQIIQESQIKSNWIEKKAYKNESSTKTRQSRLLSERQSALIDSPD